MMDVTTHIQQATEMIRTLSVLDDALRDTIISHLSSNGSAPTRETVTEARVGLRNLALMDAAQTSEKDKIDKLLLGALTKLPEAHAESEPSAQVTEATGNSTPAPNPVRDLNPADNADDLLLILVSIARKYDSAQQLPLAFFAELADILADEVS